MALVTRWERGEILAPSPSYFGHAVMYTPGASETILRVHWSWYAHNFFNSDLWPPGTSCTKVGLVWDVGTGPDTPTPISQPDADWMALHTAVWDSQFIRISTINQWELHSRGPVQGFDTKSMRKQVSVGPAFNLSMSWETLRTSDQPADFTYAAMGSYSVLVGSPAS